MQSSVFLLKNNKCAFLIVLFLLFFSNNSFADMYKCTDASGKTSYQATPCKGEKQTEIKAIKKKRSVKNNSEQCRSSCDSKHLICVSNLKDGTWNTDGGLEICKAESKACYTSCDDSYKGKLAKSSAKYKRSLYEIDNKYKRKSEARVDKRKREDQLKCAEAKSNHKKAQQTWDDATFSYSRRKALSDTEKRHYLNAIETASRDIKYDCN